MRVTQRHGLTRPYYFSLFCIFYLSISPHSPNPLMYAEDDRAGAGVRLRQAERARPGGAGAHGGAGRPQRRRGGSRQPHPHGQAQAYIVY